MIYEYQSDDYNQVINCLIELQTTESLLESTTGMHMDIPQPRKTMPFH